jgi:predicted outer membrane repeat protein
MIGGKPLEPLVPYELPSYGAGVYCAANTKVIFDGCTFENNIASEALATPNHRLSPYIGYGGGVSAERNAMVSFTDCNFVDNQADTGGAIYVSDTDAMIVKCNIVSNTALRGGGFQGVRGVIDIKRTVFSNNQGAPDVNDPNDDEVLSTGAGLCIWSIDAFIRDCVISGNQSNGSGGGIYLRGDCQPDIMNCLIINNSAGRDGGGISTNWYAGPTIANCTFSGNAASGTAGDQGDTGLGGGLYCAYQSHATVTDSIFWNNYGLKGQEIAVGSGFELDPLCGSVDVFYSDVKSSLNNVWFDPGCVLNLRASDGNIDGDPLFVSDYHLSQAGVSSSQTQTSPCVNAGSDYASHVGLLGYTTRTDDVRDTGIVDMGYHYNTKDKCRYADFVFDGVIDVKDYDKFAQILGFVDFEAAMEKWLKEPLDMSSSQSNDWRSGTDITTDNRVNGDDLQFLVIDCNGVADINAPTPNPSEWKIEPYLSSSSSISMEARTAFDAWSRDVKYYFDCITPGGHDSGWQDETTYTDTGLTIDIGYGYRVRARDKFGNMTDWSEIIYSGIDTVPPAPAPYIDTINSNSPTSVVMLATPAFDYSGVEYYFENTTDNTHDSGWQDDPNYTDTGLDPNSLYGYRVRARDKSSRQNITGWSDTVFVRTLVPPDTIPPTPDPMEWDTTVDANGVDGTPHLVNRGGGPFDYYAEMTAVVATDASGGTVEYFFECIDEHGFNSGWITTPTYSIQVGGAHNVFLFRVRARDQYGNMTDWSVPDPAD